MFDGPYTPHVLRQLCQVVGVDEKDLISIRVWEGKLEVEIPGATPLQTVKHLFHLDHDSIPEQGAEVEPIAVTYLLDAIEAQLQRFLEVADNEGDRGEFKDPTFLKGWIEGVSIARSAVSGMRLQAAAIAHNASCAGSVAE